jgi:DNA-binding MarR family transcriptional regulator
MARGRPPHQITVRRAQVLTYWRKHGPCTLGQLVRALNISDRSTAARYLKDLRAMELLPTMQA